MTLPRDETCGRLTLDGHLTPTCRCYEAGYGQGKLEMQAWKPGDHFDRCGCVPCKFARRIRHDDHQR